MKIYPPIIAVFYLIIAKGLSYFLPNIKIMNYPYSLSGFIILVIGFGLIWWAAQLFHQQGTTHNPYGSPKKLVIIGPYKFTRNPMYVGQTLIMIGIAILVGELYLFLVSLVFIITINIFFIPREEKKLEQLFGVDYLSYKKQVRRWL